MKIADFLPNAVTFPLHLVQHIRRAISEPYMACEVRGTGAAHGYQITVRDTEDGELYRVTVEPEWAALVREDMADRAAERIRAFYENAAEVERRVRKARRGRRS